MIKITGIEIEDFGRHKKIKHDLEGHVVGLAGPNGKGKSTVIQAIQFALTGTIDHPDALPSFIRQSSEDKPPKKASVTVRFEADGKKGSIKRVITKNSNTRELLWEGLDQPGTAITADKRVAEVLFDILGVDKKAINSTVFIKQGELGNMFGKDSERRDFYTRLLMLGHLDKVADTVDIYRKQIDDSTHDLSAVKDAADAAYTQASDYFSEADEKLSSMVSVKDDINTALRLVQLFNSQTEAEQKLADATTAYTAAIPPGSNPETLKDDDERKVAELEQILADYKTLRGASAIANIHLRDAENSVRKLEQASAAFDNLQAASEALAGALSPDTEDPSVKRAFIESQLSSYAKLQTLTDAIPLWETKAAEAVKAVGEADAIYKHSVLAADSLRESVNRLTSDIAVRKNIQSEMVGCSDASCLVCGSKSPDSGFLSDSIAKLTAERSTLDAKLAEAVTHSSAARQTYDQAFADERKATVTLDNYKTEAKKLRVELMAAGSEESLRAESETLRQAAEAWLVGMAERRRLSTAFEVAQRATSGLLAPTPAEVEAAKVELEKAIDAHLRSRLPLDIDTIELENQTKLSAVRTTMSKRSAVEASLTAAKSAVVAAESSIRSTIELISRAHTKLADRLTVNGMVLTSAIVAEAAEEMRAEQTAYDNQFGAVSAARDALKQASAAVDEVDLKIAEQAHRRALSKDLVRLRDTFKPSGASLEYLDYKFGQIARMASDYLAESQADFMVAASPDIPLSFEFVRIDRPDEVWMPQNRMSGGQKVRLAVAALRAIHALVMPNVGLLVLDEPTTHLDDEAVKSMAEMLRKIGDEGTLQMVVCDHNPVLIDAFSDRIDIPE